MFGILNIMNERRKREQQKMSMNSHTPIDIVVDNTHETLLSKIIDAQKSCKSKCIISDCKRVGFMNNGDLHHYKCIKHHDN